MTTADQGDLRATVQTVPIEDVAAIDRAPEEVLLRECEAMVRWAAGRGLTIDPHEMEIVSSAGADLAGLISPSVEMQREHRNARANLGAILAIAHGRLSEVVSPALPKTIVRIEHERERHRIIRFFGPLPIVRRLVFGSILLLMLFIAFASSGTARESVGDAHTPAVPRPQVQVVFR